MLTRALLIGAIFALPYLAHFRCNGSPAIKDKVEEAIWSAGLEAPVFYGPGLLRCGRFYGIEFTALQIADQAPVSAIACCGWSSCEIRY